MDHFMVHIWSILWTIGLTYGPPISGTIKYGPILWSHNSWDYIDHNSLNYDEFILLCPSSLSGIILLAFILLCFQFYDATQSKLCFHHQVMGPINICPNIYWSIGPIMDLAPGIIFRFKANSLRN